MVVVQGRPSRRSTEDLATFRLAQLCGTEPAASVVWQALAPTRLRNLMPDRLETFGRLGEVKPDLLFWLRSKPLLYVEVKLGCQTEPLQLTRGRSWMRQHGCSDDQIVLVAQMSDNLPKAVGWGGPAVPVRTVLWSAVIGALDREQVIATELLCCLNPSRSRDKTKRLLFASQHAYGAVMTQIASAWTHNGAAEFVYGGSIDPRLCLGRKQWEVTFGTRDIERLRLSYGPENEGQEYYRAQLLLWHSSDLAGSRQHIERFWLQWRKAIMADPELEFSWGQRQHRDRSYSVALPRPFPQSMVGLLRLPATRRLYAREISSLGTTELVTRINDVMLRPLEKVVSRVEKLFTRS